MAYACGKWDSRSLKYGTDFSTWLFEYSALGLEIVPEESLREYKTIFVSANRPEEMEWFRASRKGRGKGGAIVSTEEHASHVLWGIYTRGCSYLRSG